MTHLAPLGPPTAGISGETRYPDGTIHRFNGDWVFPDGTTVFGNGSIWSPTSGWLIIGPTNLHGFGDHTIYYQGHWVYPDGRILYPDGSLRLPDGTVVRGPTGVAGSGWGWSHMFGGSGGAYWAGTMYHPHGCVSLPGSPQGPVLY
ncbi:MAG: T-complex 10 C-terminal domain-containing protein [bacterium]|nr:T-complex 10 C-terminal domain-containing protein [bacterium]